MGGSDAHPSFFAHLSHLGPSGGDFKASRQNCIQMLVDILTDPCVQMSWFKRHPDGRVVLISVGDDIYIADNRFSIVRPVLSMVSI